VEPKPVIFNQWKDKYNGKVSDKETTEKRRSWHFVGRRTLQVAYKGIVGGPMVHALAKSRMMRVKDIDGSV
jgi:hypothetical protein